jgi:hypothetical protein
LYGNITLHKKLSLVSGVQYINQKTDQNYLSISSFGPYKTALGDSAKANNFSIYNSLLLTDVKGFNVEAGFVITTTIFTEAMPHTLSTHRIILMLTQKYL